MNFHKTRSGMKPPRADLTQPVSLPAPTGGLNSRDPISAMDAQYAISAVNFLATPQGLSVRQGWKKWATGMSGLVSSLLPYKGQGSTNDKLFACAGTNIYDVTQGVDSPTPVVTGLNNAFWEHVLMTTNGGNYLVACNGADPAMFYNGTSWNQFTFASTPSAPGQIASGGPMTNLSNWKQAIVHQRRLWIVQANSTMAFYLPVDSVGGAATSFDFGPVFPRGGTLKALASWSVDYGLGVQNMLVAVSSAGDVAIYAGTNPATASTWTIAGQWQLAEPVGQRCLSPYGPDLLYLSQDGLQPLSAYLHNRGVDNTTAMTLLVQPDISSLVSSFGSLHGFEMRLHPGANVLILNVPQINADQNIQYVYNTIMNGWTVFQGWPAQCWAYMNGVMYFGYNGGVAMAFVGYRDGAERDGSGGNSYTATAQQAYSYFGFPGKKKRFLQAKPHLVTTVAAPSVRVGFNVDFALDQPNGVVSLQGSSGSVWDAGKWDQAAWTAGANTFSSWQTLGAIGTAGSLTISITVNDSTLWAATDFLIETGGYFG